MHSSFFKSNPENIYGFVVKDEDNKEVVLNQFKDKVILIINSATECSFTDQYDELQPLYEKYKDKGFVILDFPCNQFGGQAPGMIKEIIKYCDMEYEITFPILNKVEVNGENADPLFSYLKSQQLFQGFDVDHPMWPMLKRMIGKIPRSNDTGEILWNFTKFLVDREGCVVDRFEPTAPMAEIEREIVFYL